MRQDELLLNLHSRSRDGNEKANDLRHGKYDLFNDDRRIQAVRDQLYWIILPDIKNETQQFYTDLKVPKKGPKVRRSVGSRFLKRSAREKLRQRDPWSPACCSIAGGRMFTVL